MFRIDPKMGPGSYKTYQIRQPKTPQTRIGSCEAAGCANFEFGWRTVVPLNSPQSEYIRNKSGRRFRETVEGLTCVFTFYPGQQCFTVHHVSDRPQFFLVRGGDWRAVTGPSRMHSRPMDWVEDFGEHQAKLAEEIEKG